jgi:hypothetical protein
MSRHFTLYVIEQDVSSFYTVKEIEHVTTQDELRFL